MSEIDLSLPGLEGAEAPPKPSPPKKQPTVVNIRKVGNVFITLDKKIAPGESSVCSKKLAQQLVDSGNCEIV